MADKSSDSPYQSVSRRTFFLGAFATLVGAALFPARAFAITWSPALSKTVNGIAYKYQSGVKLGDNPTAYTHIIASKAVAAGAMKANAIIVRETDIRIVASSGWKPCATGKSLTAQVSSSTLKLGHASKGKVIISGVNGQLTCNPIKGRAARPPLLQNENGQTLGTYEDTEYGYEPDLLAIVADSGAEGYALYEQFMAEELPDSIPVYAEDGCTEIGTFTFGDR